ncbi:Transmembrane protein [Quillaja saponaria]|uniref:Transmembrane protein n=1 Tax=Quillaja saponaria TaxID=32244 RepID=A0AAD7QFA7_QUISA|nr:Transmembrane protein [Quillaja saponaria]
MLEGELSVEYKEKTAVKEKRKKTCNKKPPKPPRAPSLDVANQKLIREISELAMLKRARIERMKAIKKMKAGKTSSSCSNIFPMVFTILFCLVITFQLPRRQMLV